MSSSRPDGDPATNAAPATGMPDDAADGSAKEASRSTRDALSAPPQRGTPQPSQRAISRRITAEVWIVIGLSLGSSAVYAILRLVDRLTREVPLSSQSAALNASQNARPWLDLLYQIAGIALTLVPVALTLYLLSAGGRSAVRAIGFEFTRPLRDLGVGVGLAAVIGLPGLALYYAGRAVGITVQIQASALDAYVWTVPILILSALKNAIVEEVIVVGYLMTRLRDLRWPTWAIFTASAALRGSYHLYQGFGPFLGNAVMGVVFAEYFRRTRRVMPLVVAHTLIDVVAFVGYALLPQAWRDTLMLS